MNALAFDRLEARASSFSTAPRRSLPVERARARFIVGAAAAGMVTVWIFATGNLLLSAAIAFALPALGLVAVLMILPGGHSSVPHAPTIGRYELVEKLAEGGMGQIWLARHDLLSRPAVVKLIRPDLLRSDRHPETRHVGALARFELEAQCIASLRSPHTVALYDYGRTDDGIAYYVMELLHGIDLDELVHRFGPQPPARVVHLLLQICHSLAEAHGLGLIHRDIKPGNIRVTVQAGDYDVVKVLDFGLVRACEEAEHAPVTRLTGEHFVLGTPAFLAPEQALGGEGGDHRIDLYALGCVAYFLLTGQLVFQAETAAETMCSHLHKAPDRPSTWAPTPIPPELEWLVLDLLAKKPESRPSSAAEVARRLAGVPLRPSWSASLAERWWRARLPEAIGAGTGGHAALAPRVSARVRREDPATRGLRRPRRSIALLSTGVGARRRQRRMRSEWPPPPRHCRRPAERRPS